MSVNTDAILFYGFCGQADDMLPVVEDGEEDYTASVRWEEEGYAGEMAHRLAVHLGMPAPKDDAADYLAALGLCVNVHCSEDSPMLYVGLGRTVKVASRGNPESLTVVMAVTITDKEVVPLRMALEWAKKLIPQEEWHKKSPWTEIGWWLVSYWE